MLNSETTQKSEFRTISEAELDAVHGGSIAYWVNYGVTLGLGYVAAFLELNVGAQGRNPPQDPWAH